MGFDVELVVSIRIFLWKEKDGKVKKRTDFPASACTED